MHIGRRVTPIGRSLKTRLQLMCPQILHLGVIFEEYLTYLPAPYAIMKPVMGEKCH